MNLENAKKEFEIFVQQYDLEHPKIQRKLGHSYRVMENAGKIAESLNLSEEEIELARLIGLLHDIGHFETIKIKDILKENKKIDHGDFGVEILKNNNHIRKYIEESKYDNIIFKAIKNHNKFKMEEGLSERELLFSKIIRDADKLDIFYEGAEMFWTTSEEIEEVNNSEISDLILKLFMDFCIVDRKKTLTKADRVLNIISFIFDINYKYDFEVLKKENYINRILDKFEFKNKINASKIKEVRKIANEYIEKQL